MDGDLKEQLVYVMLRFKKIGMTFPLGFDVRLGELFVMNGIAGNTSCSDIQSNLNITKPAVSQILNNLEKKGYVNREIDKSDRRKISVTLTARGQEILKETKKYADQTLEMTISRFGEENTRQLISLLTQLVDISEEIKHENTPADK